MDRFKVFAAAARYGSVTRASEELCITQPAVTKQLKALERDYNTNLYRRNGRGIELTEAGQVFLGKVRTILRNYDSLTQTSKANGSAARVETLTIGGTYSPSASLLPSPGPVSTTIRGVLPGTDKKLLKACPQMQWIWQYY
jgi:DNA-binding transcriptional LysR family regulator